MKMILRTLVLMLFVASICHAQEKCKVEGTVKELSGPAVVGAAITVKSSLGTGTGRTDKEGKYSVSVLCTENSKHTVSASKAGYTIDTPNRPWDKYVGAINFTARKQGK
jgi:hypothetical protein